MKRGKRPLWLLALGILLLAALFYIIIFFSPNNPISIFSSQFVFIVLFSLISFSLLSYFLKSYKQGAIISLFIAGIALLRLFHLLSMLLFVLLILLFLCLEYLFK
jgi:hypothetical protein